MKIEEFINLKVEDKVIYNGTVLIVKIVDKSSRPAGILFVHNEKYYHPDNRFNLFWEDDHEKLIRQMIKLEV